VTAWRDGGRTRHAARDRGAAIVTPRMRLTVDLRFGGSLWRPEADERVVTLDQIAATRTPRGLQSLLRGRHWDVVRVLRDDRPLNGVQAGALGLAALAAADRFEIVGARRTAVLGRPAMLARATATFATAFPAEVARTVLAHRRAAAAAAADHVLRPVPTGQAMKAVTYLRSEPSLRYMGAHVGGAAAHTAGVIEGLRRNGVAVHVFAAERPAGIDGITVTEVPPRRILHLVHWATLADYSEQQVHAAAGTECDAVYQRYALGSYAGLELARRLDVPLILEFNGSEIWADREWGGGQLRFAETLAALERRQVHAASLVVVVSDVIREQLANDGVDPSRILVNPNGVDTDRLAAVRAVAPAAWRSRLQRPEAPTVGFIGTFGPWHGVLLLPAIAAAVAARRDDARWILIGDGALMADVRDLLQRLGVADRTTLTGVVPHERAVELLAACDVCVSPHVPNADGSRFFGSPTKLFEYMGLGRAIVASDLEQIGEVIEHERTGLLVPPGDAEGTARAVVRLLDDEALRRRLGEAALESARTTYSWEMHARRILRAASGLATG
jgi:glycosyltransferase involved in cell wall biosynthesis